VTAELKLPVPATVAEHWLVCPVSTEVGKHETLTKVMEAGGGVTVMLAVPASVESSVDVAVIVSDPEAGTVAGAVYTPELVMVPEVAVHVTVEL
jgi:hypothetical protein